MQLECIDCIEKMENIKRNKTRLELHDMKSAKAKNRYDAYLSDESEQFNAINSWQKNSYLTTRFEYLKIRITIICKTSYDY